MSETKEKLAVEKAIRKGPAAGDVLKLVRSMKDAEYVEFFGHVSRGLWARRKRMRLADLPAIRANALERGKIEEEDWQPAEDQEHYDSGDEPPYRTCDTDNCREPAVAECQRCRHSNALCKAHAEANTCEQCHEVAWCSCTCGTDGRACFKCGARLCMQCQFDCLQDGDEPLCATCAQLVRLVVPDKKQ